MDKLLLLLQLLSIILPQGLCQSSTTASPAPTSANLPTSAGSGQIDFYSSSGTVSSSSYVPNDRPVRFLFVIHTLAPYVIKIRFQWLSLQNDSACMNESLEVIDGDAWSRNTLVVLCGTGRGPVPPNSLKSTGQNLTLALTSTEPLQGRGFNLTYDYMASTRTTRDCGVETGGLQMPWLASLYDAGNNRRCDAALVSGRWLVTTASCVGGRPLDPASWLAMFRNNGTYLTVAAIVPHPKFNASTSDYDFAMVGLGVTVSPSDEIRPACLPHPLQQSPLPGKSCFVQSTTYGYATGIHVSMLDQNDCKAVYNASAVTSRMMCGSSEVCLTTVVPSPLLCKEVDGRLYLTGLSSWGDCGHTSYVFARIWRIISFIDQYANSY